MRAELQDPPGRFTLVLDIARKVEEGEGAWADSASGLSSACRACPCGPVGRVGVDLWRTEVVVSLARGLCIDWEFEERLRSAEPRVALPARYRISSASEHASRT